RAWQAAEEAPSQARTLPDPEIEIQQFSVGSPRPFAGYSNSNFAYIGFGISQDLPYPGKLRLKGEIAARAAAVAQQKYSATERAVVLRLKSAYFQLAASAQTLTLLAADQQLLAQIEKAAEAAYSAGKGNQQDVLKAQLQQTRLLRDIALENQQKGDLEAQIKQLLNRPPQSSAIVPAVEAETPLSLNEADLRTLVRAGNPAVRAAADHVDGQALRLNLAHKNFYPDFSVQYMWQHTAAPFRDYYMLGIGLKLPIHRQAKLRPEVAEAAARLAGSRLAYEDQVQQIYAEVHTQFLAAKTGARILRIYRQGLMPQAEAEFHASLAAYESHREDFQTLLSSFLDVLNLDQEYWQALASHEIAIATLEELTGAPLFPAGAK
ncbi:MAG: TolC family protein, partial [Acidobacteriota bacterium]|nr:TolC family protein [Acidobacteriota bacterium]